METSLCRAIAVAERQAALLASPVELVRYDLSLLPDAARYIEGSLLEGAGLIRSLRCLATHARGANLGLRDVVMDLHLDITVRALLLVDQSSVLMRRLSAMFL